MRVAGACGGPGGKLIVGVVSGVLLVMAAACSSSSGESSDTLDPLQGTPGDTGSATTLAGPAPTGPATVDPASAGAGFVSVHVEVANAGIDETVSLDRASVRRDELDPLSLDATCSALDGGDAIALSVIDLRRLATGGQVVSAALRTDEPATSPGEYEGTVEIADASQLTTSYDSMIIVDEGGWSGSFEGIAENGGVASGTFVCSQQAIAPTTTIAIDEGEEVPDTTSP
jgi:hypothetical protein